MDGVRTAKGGEGVTGAMIRARIRVDGRLAGGLRRFWGCQWRSAMGAGGQDEDRGHGKKRLRTEMARVGGGRSVGRMAGQWQTGAVRLGVEWLAAVPGRD